MMQNNSKSYIQQEFLKRNSIKISSIRGSTFQQKQNLSARGFCKYCNLFHTNQSQRIQSLQAIDNTIQIVSISVGDYHTAILSSIIKVKIKGDGEVFMMGSNKFGQLGIKNAETQAKFNKVSIMQKITSVSCGSEHTLALNEQGNVYTWGLNMSGQLGTNDYENQYQPFMIQNFYRLNQGMIIQLEDQLIQNNDLISEIACGSFHSILKSKQNKIYSTGQGQTYALGHKQGQNLCQFTQIQFFDNLSKAQIQISAGLSHSGLILNGNAYLWGQISKQQLLKEPKLIEFNENIQIKDMKLSDNLSVFLQEKDDVWVLGDNINNQLGILDQSAEKPIKLNIKATQITLGRNFVIAINNQTQQVYGWGCNQYNQIISGNQKQIKFPTRLQSIEKYEPQYISSGFYQTFAISSIQPNFQYLSDSQQFEQMQLQHKKQQDDFDQNQREKNQDKQKYQFVLRDNDQLRIEQSIYKEQIESLENQIQIFKNQNQHIQQKSKMDQKSILNKSISLNDDQKQVQNTFEIDIKEIKFEKQISEGGFGIIYRARWRESVVVVKMLKIEGMNELQIKDFQNECKAMQALRHPNICMFMGACTKPPNFALVLEYCSKGSLWSVLQNLNIPLTWDDRRRIALDAARGIHFLHSFSPPILHRDIKSLNLLMDESYRVKLADFGWTRSLGPSMTGKIGTYQWMAPEVISSQEYTEKADVFSYGIILWEIASREPPYKMISGLQVSIQVVNNNLRPEIPKKTPEGFSKLVRKCWDKDPNKRPSFIEIIKDLESFKF